MSQKMIATYRVHYQHLGTWIRRCGSSLLFWSTVCISSTTYASYIETTIGTAVINDATATYYNPAALILIKNPQIVPLVNTARFHTRFKGSDTSIITGFTEFGTSRASTNYYSPSLYMGMPVNSYLTVGFAAVTNFAERNPESHSILRYTQSSNNIQDYDFVPALGVKVNNNFSIGLNINFSQLNLNLHPLTGFPGSNIADSQSNNQSTGVGIGMDVGGLLQFSQSTLIGFNYRSVTKYNEHGKSIFNGMTQIISDHYHFSLRTPARSTLTISQSLVPDFRLMTTIQHIQWGTIRNIHVFNIATQSGIIPTIVNANIPQYLKDTWAFTFGGQYRFQPDWVVRLATTYNQSPAGGHYQVDNGNSYVIGASIGYDINKIFKIDASYAHVFMENQLIDINGNRFLIDGINQGSRDAVSLKLTMNFI